MATDFTTYGTPVTSETPSARRWESVICYEDRDLYHTSRWRFLGVSTKQGSLNTDNGTLWLSMAKSGSTVTATIYKDEAKSAAVATGTADVSTLDGTGEESVQVSLAAFNGSGLSGSFWVHEYTDDGTAPIQVAMCVDEDLHSLWGSVEDLEGFDDTYGMAEFIRVAGDDVLGRVSRMFADEMGGHGVTEAWYITDADRSYPDLRRIANPAQLRMACAYRALAIGIGRDHERARDTTYSYWREQFNEQFEIAMASLTLTLKPGGSADAEATTTVSTRRMSRA